MSLVYRRIIKNVLKTLIISSLACQSGFFGENCRMKCVTKCAGCNNVNGVCNYGCLPGFTGYVCQEGK